MPSKRIPAAPALPYRADIDGLRAIAIIPVVLYHANLAFFSGGFVGVDVFFVISGFLITGLIYAKIREGKFSLVDFYERRVRRILPALVVMLLAVSVAAWFLLLPDEYKNYSESLYATTLFGSNVYFWLTTNYFDSPAESKPLLHTWSLAVEEQYYIFFPLFLAFLFSKFKRRIHLILWSLFALSLVVSAFGAFLKPVITFYSSPTRAWELLCGSLLAVGSVALPRTRSIREVLGVAGLGLIAYSVTALNETSTFPGLNALFPCLGTVMIIMAGTGHAGSVVNGVLASRVPVSVGRVSYSLYLWHWPLFVFAHMLSPAGLSWSVTLLVLLLSLAAAYLSWWFVEQPIRQKRILASRRNLFAAGAIALALFTAVGVYGVARDGYPERFPEFAKLHQGREADKRQPTKLKDCWFLTQNHDEILRDCRLGPADSREITLVWGDSFGRNWMPAFEVLADKYGSKVIVASLGGCPPIIDAARADNYENGPKCRKHSEAVMRFIKAGDIKRVFIVARWDLYVDGWHRNGRLQKASTFLIDDEADTVGPTTSREVLARNLKKTVKVLRDLGIDTVLVASLPVQSADPLQLFRVEQIGDKTHGRLSIEEHLARQKFADELLRGLSDGASVHFVDPTPLLCDKGRCTYRDDSQFFYKDDSHLTSNRAVVLVPALEPYFSPQVGARDRGLDGVSGSQQ